MRDPPQHWWESRDLTWWQSLIIGLLLGPVFVMLVSRLW
jgi:hypothetical protein